MYEPPPPGYAAICGADRDDVVQAEKAEGNEQSERCLGSICGGTQRVQAKDGNALHGADLLGAFFGISEGLADEEVEETHEVG